MSAQAAKFGGFKAKTLLECHFRRCFSLLTVRSMKMPSNAPSSVKGDTVGPPDKVSNIRPYKFHQPQDETETERKYREQRTEALEFNHDFWYKHNKSFFTQKEEFVKARLAAKRVMAGGGEDHQVTQESLTPEEMSEFYKKFLDENYKQHLQYNKDWYRKNVSLLWPAAKVAVARFLKNRRKTENG